MITATIHYGRGHRARLHWWWRGGSCSVIDTFDDRATRLVGEVSVYARVSPEHKLRIVRALQERGELVAMTATVLTTRGAQARKYRHCDGRSRN
jgi:hypothetical protein